MLGFRRARLVAPMVHALVFVSTWLLFWLQPQPLLDGPARYPFATVFIADLPISAFAFGAMFNSDTLFPYAVAIWGVAGTFWWYFLGRAVERRRKR
jgi:hypothetical protein